MSSFAVAFLVLGFFTSVSELSVGINSILENDPEIYVGNLIGASIVIFLLIIPLLAIVGNGIKITPEFRGFNLPASLVVIALPVVLAMDGRVGGADSILALSLYGFLVVAIERKKGFLGNIKLKNGFRAKLWKEVLRVVFGLATIFIASKFVVQKTEYFAEILHLSPFVISLLLIGIGTNIPELSFVVRSAFMKNKQIAFGDYVGSASFNTFLIGGLTLLYGKPVVLTNSYLVSLLFLLAGLFIFYYFAKTKHSLSRIEGCFLFGIYAAFVVTEVFLHIDSF
jgi:cation:H+ antiporter